MRRRGRIMVFIIMCLFLCPPDVNADSWVSPGPFSITSDDGAKVFHYNPSYDTDGLPATGVYSNTETLEPLYLVEDLLWAYKDDLIFSGDLRYFVFIPSVSQSMALRFYENGHEMKEYGIKDLVKKMSTVTYTSSSAFWLRTSEFFPASNTLAITTTDNRIYTFDVTSGEILEVVAQPPDRREGAVPWYAVVAIAGLGIIGCLLFLLARGLPGKPHQEKQPLNKAMMAVALVLVAAALVLGCAFALRSAGTSALHDIRTIAAGSGSTAVVAADGSLWAWGEGLLGDGSWTGRNKPVHIGVERDWADVAIGWSHFVAIKTDGSLWAWGRNDSGQLGDGTTTHRTRPVQIGTDTNWAGVVADHGRTVALKTDGSLWIWPLSGQLKPVQFGTDTDWIRVSAGNDFTAAIKTDGSLWTWGSNRWGQLGDGTNIDKHAPVRVDAGGDWADVAAGYTHTVALKTDGSLWTWGNNYHGRLGDGQDADRNTPAQVGTATDWILVAADAHTLALKADGSLWGWGDNSFGQLGNGAGGNLGDHCNTPVQIGTETSWIGVTTGSSFTMALKTDGSLWGWGSNKVGQLGDGTSTDRRGPVRIAR
ncbi:MAG: hypothetical protein FWF88_10950 [Peptococcaceae bacterium]|nr:hypothetical protein [Peptococcaceae bacterium]